MKGGQNDLTNGDSESQSLQSGHESKVIQDGAGIMTGEPKCQPGTTVTRKMNVCSWARATGATMNGFQPLQIGGGRFSEQDVQERGGEEKPTHCLARKTFVCRNSWTAFSINKSVGDNLVGTLLD